MTPDQMVERLINFAARVGKVVDALPDTEWDDTSEVNWFAAALRRRRITKKHVLQRAVQTSFTAQYLS